MNHRGGKKIKKLIIVLTSSVLAAALIFGGIVFALHRKAQNIVVEVQQVEWVSTMYWGDQTTTYGFATSDFVQELYPNTETSIAELYVEEGQSVKIGDILLQYDTTKMNLTVESNDLELQKKQYELQQAKKELVRLQNTKPYVPPTPTPEPTIAPIPESTAVLYSEIDEFSKPYQGTGTAEDPYVFLCTEDCTLKSGFLLRLFGFYSEATPAPTTPPSAEPTPESSPAPTPAASAEPTSTPEPTPLPTAEPETESQPQPVSDPTPTPMPEWVLPNGPFAARLEVHEENNEHLPMLKGWAMDGFELRGGFFLDLPDADDGVDMDGVTEDDNWVTTLPSGPMYTAAELKELIAQKKLEIQTLELEVKQAEITLKRSQMELQNTTVVSAVNGTVKTLIDLETALMNGTPFLVVSGGDGFYVTGTLNEGLLDQVHVGNTVTVNSWELGMELPAQIVKISDFPTTGGYWDGISNPNSSNYSFTAFIEYAEGLQNGMYLDIILNNGEQNASPSDTLYLSKAYIREDENGRYVMKVGEDRRIHKTYIQTGRTIYNEYMELKDGSLSGTDYVAFPYGPGATEGAKADLPEDEFEEEFFEGEVMIG
ncbi:MAG: biotin/lipoyl-binding protein [Clostridia bacterium]|nr:biotin/lipoyl-binding protein [Clostridia bacterium]